MKNGANISDIGFLQRNYYRYNDFVQIHKSNDSPTPGDANFFSDYTGILQGDRLDYL